MTTAITNDALYTQLGLSNTSKAANDDALGQQDFLELMTVQMQNQNPLKPLENSEFFSQIAQFSTVSGIGKLQSSFESLATQLSSSQSLQGASLIGRDVLVPSDTGVLGSEGMSGVIAVPASGRVQLEVRNSSGALIRTLDLGTQPAGNLDFKWDGTDSASNAQAAGSYAITATVQGSGSSQAANTYASDRVDSVAFSGGSLYLSLNGLGTVAFGNVVQIH